MLGVAKKYTKVIRALKELNEGEKVAGVIKARFGAYKAVIEGVKENANDFIFILIQKVSFMKIPITKNKNKGITSSNMIY